MCAIQPQHRRNPGGAPGATSARPPKPCAAKCFRRPGTPPCTIRGQGAVECRGERRVRHIAAAQRPRERANRARAGGHRGKIGEGAVSPGPRSGRSARNRPGDLAPRDRPGRGPRPGRLLHGRRGGFAHRPGARSPRCRSTRGPRIGRAGRPPPRASCRDALDRRKEADGRAWAGPLDQCVTDLTHKCGSCGGIAHHRGRTGLSDGGRIVIRPGGRGVSCRRRARDLPWAGRVRQPATTSSEGATREGFARTNPRPGCTSSTTRGSATCARCGAQRAHRALAPGLQGREAGVTLVPRTITTTCTSAWWPQRRSSTCHGQNSPRACAA